MTTVLLWYAVLTAALLTGFGAVVAAQWCTPRLVPLLRAAARSVTVQAAPGR